MEHVFFCTGHELKIPNIVKSEGLYLYDKQGKSYMDLESGVWCTSIGHNIEGINGIIKNQINSLMHAGFCYSNEILEESAQSILKAAGFNHGKSVFLCSGSEAIEISSQMAKHLTAESVSLTLHDSYLGAYSSITDKSRNWHLLNWEQCKICSDKDKCDLSCEVLKKIPKYVSEFIFEPGSSSGFVRFPPKAMIKNIVKIVRDNNGKIVANEVTTGIGRTGKWFGYQHYDINPDFIAVGKGVGNGYPVSIALINEYTARQLELKPFHYSQSHQNDPLGASIVKGVIQYIENNDLISEAQKNGALLQKHLESIVDKEIILEVRGRGLMFAVDIKNEGLTNSIYSELIKKGYIVGNRGSSLRIDPPLTITKTEIDGFIEVLRETISHVKLFR
ncbi:aminotransferase class III-fold pyridoxal phosphate-dependent enzyme [uncultured Desulfosarcina sp.]|uniref:aminotransferase class III-fold pyridoxal phosphate-dependent enzyme n=1 Tax=uncultured Desulfosarcina sp. TaxID=218289 RepID=UPI0029C6A235|nr:aminotransferase class III-fold pyridoxal phosphate-dependent enzyme [uncultured Desulfosarcina sp.]